MPLTRLQGSGKDGYMQSEDNQKMQRKREDRKIIERIKMSD